MLKILYTVAAFSVVCLCHSMYYVRVELSADRIRQIDDFVAEIIQVRQTIEKFSASGSGLEEVLGCVEAEKTRINQNISDDDDVVYNEVMREWNRLIYCLAESYHKHKGSLQLSDEVQARLQALGIIL